MKTCQLIGFLSVLAIWTTPSSADTREEVDMLLCLAADVSESVTKQEYQLQREGHATAISDPQVVEVIRSGLRGKIAATYMEWAKQDQQHLGVDWQVIADGGSATEFSRKVSRSSMPPWIKNGVRNTSTSQAIRYCMDHFTSAPVRSDKWVIDISSDGTNNIGAQITDVRDEAIGKGATINVLAIVGSDNPFLNPAHEDPDGGLVNYFRSNVAGGRGAFVEVAEGYQSFSRIIKRKFLLEFASVE